MTLWLLMPSDGSQNGILTFDHMPQDIFECSPSRVFNPMSISCVLKLGTK